MKHIIQFPDLQGQPSFACSVDPVSQSVVRTNDINLARQFRSYRSAMKFADVYIPDDQDFSVVQ